MRAVIQRVRSANVRVDDEVIASIDRGLLVLVGFEAADTDACVPWLADKLAHLRIFEDTQDKMNLGVGDVGGAILLVPNFTLAGEAAKGRRPSFDRALRPEQAQPLFDALAHAVHALDVPVATGRFRASMQVSLVNDGPVTILLNHPAS